MEPHPEGGYFKEVYRSNEKIAPEALPERYKSDRNFGTSIYYLLKSGESSKLHRLKSDEIWHFYYGSPIAIHIIHPNSDYQRIVLGSDIDKGEFLQYTIKAGCWFGAAPLDENSYSLVGCNVFPGFDFDDFEMGKRDELLDKFPEHSDIIHKLTAE